MKILYLINYNLNENSGVINKIRQQVCEWKRNNSVYLFSISNFTLYDADFNIISKKENFPLFLNRKGKIFTFLRLLYSSYKLPKIIQDIQFDMIYMRYLLYMPFLISIIKKYKVIMEINSDDILEYKLGSKLTYYYNLFTRDKILNNMNGFVAVSDELKEKFLHYKKSIKVIANGIDSKSYHYRLKIDTIKPTLVFIGSPNQSWHGIDKIEKMAKYFSKYQFYIIGISKKDTHNIKYLGYLKNEKATEIISQCDIGIGTLSLYQKGLTEASPLKTRQYFACALPVIYGYKDTDIQEDIDFGLQLENCDNNMDYKKIETFVEKVYKNEFYRKEARRFAEDVLDYRIKEKKRISFFDKVLNDD